MSNAFPGRDELGYGWRGFGRCSPEQSYPPIPPVKSKLSQLPKRSEEIHYRRWLSPIASRFVGNQNPLTRKEYKSLIRWFLFAMSTLRVFGDRHPKEVIWFCDTQFEAHTTKASRSQETIYCWSANFFLKLGAKDKGPRLLVSCSLLR